MREQDEFIERQIIVGLIVSTEYHQRVQRFWDPTLLESPELRTVAGWCTDYFEAYEIAPDRNIESIYMEQLQDGNLTKHDAIYIEEVLTDLSDEYGRDELFNAPYLYDKTLRYFKARELEELNREIAELVEAGLVEEAELKAQNYQPKIRDETETGIDLSSPEIAGRIERAFNETGQRVLSYPGALGSMWNEHLIRGGFFSLLAPEKRGKSMMLMDMALRAVRQKANVAYFEAGDMTEAQVLRRIAVYIARQSDRERYCQERFQPIGDCIFNQIDTCTRKDRNCDHGIFPEASLEQMLSSPAEYTNIDTLTNKFEEYPDYEPCKSRSCNQRKGTVWLRKIPATRILTGTTAVEKVQNYFQRYRRRFKFVSYPAGTLTVSEMRRCLNDWETYDGFVPDLIVVDYADLLSSSDGGTTDFRHSQDHVWKGLRALSQERHALLVTATQADAASYTKGRLSISNFSEDKRKLAHVTAQYGLNQDPQGREKQLGILRINEIVVREGAYSGDNEICVLQDLAISRAFLESYSTIKRE